jgi:alanyl-tRNA synthetase
MFGEKYGEQVRVVSAGTFSSEFCGGCHVNRTGDIGLFKIVSDRSLAAGVRRMEGLTGRGALEYLQSLEGTARETASHLNTAVAEVPAMVRSLQERQKQLEKELKQMRVQLASAGSGVASAEEQPIDVDGVRLLTRQVRDVSGGDLRNLADTLRQKVKSGVVLIGSEADGKATLLAAVTSDVQAKVSASALISKLAPLVGGKGGGKPDLAQAGGKDPAGIPNALAQAESVIREMLAR